MEKEQVIKDGKVFSIILLEQIRANTKNEYGHCDPKGENTPKMNCSIHVYI